MKQWEYKVISLRDMFDSGNLRESGDEGWELVSIVPTTSIGGLRAVFKREKEQP